MGKIAQIHAREILDSRGIPTLEVGVILYIGVKGGPVSRRGLPRAPTRLLNKRDGDPQRYFGKGVLQAVAGIHREIAQPFKANRSASNALWMSFWWLWMAPPMKAVWARTLCWGSALAVAHAAAAQAQAPLHQVVFGAASPRMPLPLMNVINGGKHADNVTDIQEFMIIPLGAPPFERLNGGERKFFMP